MTSAESLRQQLLKAFRMPTVQTMVSRKSSITNAFVNAVIPSIMPSPEEIREALTILEMQATDVHCAYCGDRSTEWDHLRPLVVDRRPTGYISEIANLVPACGKCNQSKGNKHWRKWLLSPAKLSPTGRKLDGIEARAARLEKFEKWRTPIQIDFLNILGEEAWERYWAMCDAVNEDLKRAHAVAIAIRESASKAVSERDNR